MVELKFLGGALLLQDGRPLSGTAARRHPVALLALLATTTGHSLSRSKAAGLLWPDVGEATARNRLSSTLYLLRQLLGKDVVTSAGDNLRLDPESVNCDVWNFRAALESGDLPQAMALYDGPFLDGFYLEDSTLFEERVDTERQKLELAWRNADETSQIEPSIAVLPFESPDDVESAELGDGIHSGILNRLARLEGLTVIAWTSVRCYRGTQRKASEIGTELGVHWVLEGRVHARDEQIRVDARLVEAHTDRQVWAYDLVERLAAETYFKVQTEIAAQIVELLRHQLTPKERRELERNPTESLAAHRLSTQGRMDLDHRSRADMERALKSFEDAVALDPDYALAWVGVADALGLLHAYGFAGRDVLGTASRAIDTALEKDSCCAEAIAAHGRMLGQHRREPEARRALERAVTLKPGYAEAHNWLTISYEIGGEIEAAQKSARRAVALNPLSAEALNNLAGSMLFGGDPAEALKVTEQVLKFEPDYGTATLYTGLALYEMGRFEEAVNALRGLELAWVQSGVDAALALSFAADGHPDSALDLLDHIREQGHEFDEGLVLAALGEKEAAFEAFGRARFDEMELGVSYWPTVCVRYLFGRVWEIMQDDRRFDDLQRRIFENWGLEVLESK